MTSEELRYVIFKELVAQCRRVIEAHESRANEDPRLTLNERAELDILIGKLRYLTGEAQAA